MKNIQLIVVLFTVIVIGCDFKQEPSPEYMKQAEFASKTYDAAVIKADNNDPAGYLTLYEMARNDSDIYPTDWQEVANEKLDLLLYSNTALWVRTFSKVDMEKFKDFVGPGFGVSQYPEGIFSEEQFQNTIIANLEKIRGDKKEMELVDHILGLYNRKRR
jgi:hypothetical protein